MLIAGGGTGGHLMPALSIAGAVRDAAPAIEPVLVGAERGIEARVLPERDFRHYLLPAEPIYRRTWWRNVRWPFVAARLLRRISAVYEREQPVAVLGTGGYASGPVVWWGARAGLPTAIQEQNAFPGLATRWLSRRVDHVYLGLPEAAARLRPGAATELHDTGNPITPPDRSRRAAALLRFGVSDARPVVLVTGGSQGALTINEAVAAWIGQGGNRDATLIWVTGRGTYVRFAHLHAPPHVHVIDFLDPMADAYAVADLVVSRAGMITVAEVCAWGLPSILVPLPTAAADHQTHNAAAMAAAGAAVNVPQTELVGRGLGAVLEQFLTDPAVRDRMAAVARSRGRPQAAREIVSLLLTLLEPK